MFNEYNIMAIPPPQLKKPTGGKVVTGNNLSTHVNVAVL
jgi:hypothetical protein